MDLSIAYSQAIAIEVEACLVARSNYLVGEFAPTSDVWRYVRDSTMEAPPAMAGSVRRARAMTAAIGDERVLWLDRETGMEIVGRDVSTDTNFAHTQVDALPAAMRFAEQIGFPTHAVHVLAWHEGAPAPARGVWLHGGATDPRAGPASASASSLMDGQSMSRYQSTTRSVPTPDLDAGVLQPPHHAAVQ